MGEKVKAVVDGLRERLDLLYGERLVRMILDGSQAPGEAEDGPDIDVLVVLRGIADRITSEAPGVVSVTYNIAPKAPSCIEVV